MYLISEVNSQLYYCCVQITASVQCGMESISLWYRSGVKFCMIVESGVSYHPLNITPHFSMGFESSQLVGQPSTSSYRPTTPFPSSQFAIDMFWYSTLHAACHLSNNFLWLICQSIFWTTVSEQSFSSFWLQLRTGWIKFLSFTLWQEILSFCRNFREEKYTNFWHAPV